MNPSERQRDIDQPSGRRPNFYDTDFMSFNETVRRMFENLFHGLEQQYRQFGSGWSSSSMISSPAQYNFGTSIGQIVNDAEKFVMQMDVSQFHPNDLKVNVRNGEISIEGHQKQQRDQHGLIERHFVRRFTLPDDIDDTTLNSYLKDNGILEITARKRNVLPATPTRNIPIQMHHTDQQQQQRSKSSKRSDSNASRTGTSNN